MPVVSAVNSRFRPLDSFEAFEAHMSELLDQAQGSDIVVLPELVTAELLTLEPGWQDATMDDLGTITKHEDRLKTWFEAQARAREQYILAGTTMVHREGGTSPETGAPRASGTYNEATLFGPEGLIVSHEKTHLFRLEGASGKIKAGTNNTVVELPIGKVGMLICYEIEIPECVDANVAQGADLIVNPSMTLSEAGSWRVLHCAQARAVENQIFVATSQMAGDPIGFSPGFWGESRVIAPADVPWPANGIVAATEPNAEAVATGDLSYDDLYMNRATGAVSTYDDRLRNAELYRSWPSRS